jgi:ABC-type phosphate/phosphonate transport system substrate-binding protein
LICNKLYASFPWYDLPEMHASNDALWNALRGLLDAAGLTELPEQLDRERTHGTDFNGACLFTQTCGYPLFTTARGHFTVLGSPRYDVAGATGSWHRSYIVVGKTSALDELEQLRGTRFAINEIDSNSGMNLPRRLFAPYASDKRFFADTVVTGSHAASAALVSQGGADAAAIDCVTFALLARYRPGAISGLRVLAQTRSTPTPPLVTSFRTSAGDVAKLKRALGEFTADPAYAPIRDALFLDGIDFCDERAYDVVMEYEAEATALGYPQLR